MKCSGEIAFSSDWHLGDARIIELQPKRPEICLAKQTRRIIDFYASKLKQRDKLYFAGDFGKASALPELNKIKCPKYFIRGNHDRFSTTELLKYFVKIYERCEFTYKGYRFVIDHYPMESWNDMSKGVIHLHGHTHDLLNRLMPRRKDIGIDAIGFDKLYTANMAIEEFKHQKPMKYRQEEVYEIYKKDMAKFIAYGEIPADIDYPRKRRTFEY